METNYRGIHNLDRDLPGQVEYNRKKNLQQDSQIENLSSQLQTLIERAPAGFLPRVYYGLTRGNQTYRFLTNALISETITGEIGTAYQLYSDNESDNSYIAAVAVKYDENTLKIIIKGDYTVNSSSFTAVNMTTGESTSLTLSGVLSLQDASSLSDYPAQDNKEKQITVLNNLENNSKNVVFASLDYSGDGIYNWVEIGNFVDGVDGTSVRSVNSSNYSTVIATIKVNDSLLAAEAFTAGGTTFAIGDLYLVSALSPLTLTLVGNIRGATGATGATGQDGTDGLKVISDSGVPSNDLGVDGDTYIDTSTWNVYTKESGSWTSVGNIKGANGADGTDGQNGQSFQMQSGLYSTPDNWGQSGNVDGEGNALLQLPTLPQSSITGKGYVVYDPLTTPLAPFYDLYYANNGDLTWTIIHPFSGIAGTNGTDGQTPYISGGTWWIGNTNTGVAATGPQGPAGPGVPTGGTQGQILTKTDSTDYNTNWVTPNYVTTNTEQKISKYKQFDKGVIVGDQSASGTSVFNRTLIKSDANNNSGDLTICPVNSDYSPNTSTRNVSFKVPSGNQNITITAPASSGTLALTSDIPSTSDFVDVESAQEITGGKTFVNDYGMNVQYGNKRMTIGKNFIAFYNNYPNSYSNKSLWFQQTNTSVSIYFPDASGTVALKSDLIIPLSNNYETDDYKIVFDTTNLTFEFYAKSGGQTPATPTITGTYTRTSNFLTFSAGGDTIGYATIVEHMIIAYFGSAIILVDFYS